MQLRTEKLWYYVNLYVEYNLFHFHFSRLYFSFLLYLCNGVSTNGTKNSGEGCGWTNFSFYPSWMLKTVLFLLFPLHLWVARGLISRMECCIDAPGFTLKGHHRRTYHSGIPSSSSSWLIPHKRRNKKTNTEECIYCGRLRKSHHHRIRYTWRIELFFFFLHFNAQGGSRGVRDCLRIIPFYTL